MKTRNPRTKPVMTLAALLCLLAPGPRWAAQAVPSTVTQTTPYLGDSYNPSISGDGTRIVFHSNANLTGGNADGNEEIFLFDAATNRLSQITTASAGGSGFPSINGDGTRIAFHSSANLTGGNADGNEEIFLFDVNSSTFTQITNAATGNSFIPSINGDGTRIAFHSSANLTGGNADGRSEIFLFDAVTNRLSQVTSAGGSGFASINGDGTRIAFNSGANLTGGNADGSYEIFLFNAATNSLTQTTNTTTGGFVFPSISGNGTRIAFFTYSEYGEPYEEIFLFDVATNSLSQITGAVPTALPRSTAMAPASLFSSYADLTGGNSDFSL